MAALKLLAFINGIIDGRDVTVTEALAHARLSQTVWFAEIMHYAYAGDTALHLAAAAYRAPLVKGLLAVGADVRARNRRGAEPIHYAADGHPDSDGWNPRAQRSTLAALIDAGAHLDALDASGVAPLHRAVRTRCSAAVEVLLARGADPELLNARGSTPLDLAKKPSGRGGSPRRPARGWSPRGSPTAPLRPRRGRRGRWARAARAGRRVPSVCRPSRAGIPCVGAGRYRSSPPPPLPRVPPAAASK